MSTTFVALSPSDERDVAPGMELSLIARLGRRTTRFELAVSAILQEALKGGRPVPAVIYANGDRITGEVSSAGTTYVRFTGGASVTIRDMTSLHI